MLKHQQLEHALALVRHGSFRRAAEAVHLSQPAFSRSIQALEEQLGVLLFDRKAGGITPTLFGEALLRRARNIVHEAAELEREVELLRGLQAGSFSVGMGAFAAAMSGARAAGELVRLHPQLKCRFSIGDWHKIGTRVLSGSVDLALAEVSEAQGNVELETEVLGQHRMVLYCRRGHPLSAFEEVTKTDLENYPLAGVRLPSRLGRGFPGIGDTDQGKDGLMPAIEIEDLATATTIVASSDAISGAALPQIEPALREGAIVCLPFRASVARFNYGFIYRRNRMLSPAAEVFMQLVRDMERDLALVSSRLEAEFCP